MQDLHSTDPIQPREPVLNHAHYTAPTRQHELDHTDHTDHTDQDSICPAWQMSIDHQVGINHTDRLSEECTILRYSSTCTISCYERITGQTRTAWQMSIHHYVGINHTDHLSDEAGKKRRRFFLILSTSLVSLYPYLLHGVPSGRAQHRQHRLPAGPYQRPLG